jgi:hypothetical protein
VIVDIYSILGWAGTVLIVGAYFLNSTKRLESTSAIYQLMNLFGAMGMLVNVFHTRTWAAVALQVVWGVIALCSLLKKKQSH